MKQCSVCGAPLEDDARFCLTCGAEQPASFEEPPAQQEEPPAKPQKAPKAPNGLSQFWAKCKAFVLGLLQKLARLPRKLLVLIVCCATALLLVLLFCICLGNCTGCGVRGAMRNAYLFSTGSRCTNIETLYPAELWESGAETPADLAAALQANHDLAAASGAVTYRIAAIERVSTAEFLALYGTALEAKGVTLSRISGAKKLHLVITNRTDGQAASITSTVFAYKLRGTWYIYND